VAVSSREELRATFEQVPELYDRARPGYPAALFDDLVDLAGLRAGGRVLEIGCGPGKATVPLAERGLAVTCVELGPQLAALARRKLAAFPKVEVINASFETWEPAEAGFDAVVAFTSLHWIDPELRYAKPARLLREGGALAVGRNAHVVPEGGDAFWAEVQEDYDAIVPGPENRPPPPPDELGDAREEIEASGHFAHAAHRRYLWELVYSAEEYVAVIDTYSRNRALPEETRARLYEQIRRRIEARPGGRVRMHYLATLDVARPR
jgi:SAM-dependent methyltransferase